MPNVGKIVAGVALVAGAVALDVATFGANVAAMPAEFAAFLAIIGSTGASLIASGTAGLLTAPPPGQGVTSQNPIQPWNIAYGQIKVGGTVVDLEDNGGILSNGSNTYDKCHNRVIMLAAHAIKSVDEVRMAGKSLLLGPGGSGAQSTTWTYTPPGNQYQTNIASIHRTGGVVTMVLVSGIPGQNGLPLNIQHVNDYSFNGIFTVTQPNPADDTTFTYLCGGADTTTSGGYVWTCYPDYKDRIHCDLTSCLGNHSSTFPEFVNNSSLWTAAHRNLGKASVYLAFYYDADVFPGGNIPQSSFVVSGKNDIYDPRLGAVTDASAHIYTTNAALIIADYLSNTTWGYGLAYGTDIPLAQLIAAANICDEQIPLAAGGTESRYTINMGFDLSQTRGAVLQDMLNACAGRITIQSGQYVIVPGAWVGPFMSLSASNLIGPVEYKPILTITESCNGVKGTYVSPVNNWQSADIPPYAEDELHGYSAGDRWLAADNGVRIWKDVSFPGVTSCPTSQRLAKIDLERLRREGRLTLHCDMSAYPAVALDVIEFTYPRYGWTNKTFEVLSSKLVVQADANGGAPTLGVDLDLAETDSDVYDWSTSEELTPVDSASPAINNGQIISGPQTLIIESGPTTTFVGADGIALARILASWESSPTVGVQSGGYYDVQYQKSGDTYWTDAGRIPGNQTQCYIGGVIAGQNYSVQVQAFTSTGVSSGFSQAGPITCSATQTFMSASNVTYPDGTPVGNLQPATAGADATAGVALAHTGSSESIIPNGDFLLGNLQGWFNTDGVGPFSYGPLGNGQNGLIITAGAPVGVGSPTFAVIPGKKYRFVYNCFAGPGSISAFLRVNYSGTYAAQISDLNRSGFTDFEGGWTSMSQGALTSYPFDWVAPAGVYYASAGVYEWTGATANVFVASVTCTPYAATGEYGADVTLNQPIVYTGASESIIPNGSFLLGNLDGWANTGFSYGSDSFGTRIYCPGNSNIACFSPTFAVIPGKKYRFAAKLYNGYGSGGIYFRLQWQATYAPNIEAQGGTTSSTVPGYQDFLGNVSVTNTPTVYDTSGIGDWTCPAGAYFASVSLHAITTSDLACAYVSCIPYGATGQFGADVTGSNTAAGIVNQGALATLNQVNTTNIVAHAVNSQVVFKSGYALVNPTGGDVIIQQGTIPTDGGYVKVSVTLTIGAGVAVPVDVRLYRGTVGGTILAEAYDVGVAYGGPADNVCVALQAVDGSPDLSAQYTVTVNSGYTVTVYCNSVNLIIENMKA